MVIGGRHTAGVLRPTPRRGGRTGRADGATCRAGERGGLFVLTGAGLSTDSGIPDYRGPDGVRRVTPIQYAEFAGSSAARRRYWARSFVGWQRFRAAAPNAGHHAVARLQQLGLVDELVTQNVDGLHQRAGSPEVVELHGSLAEVVCLSVRRPRARSLVQERLAAANPASPTWCGGRAGRVSGEQPDPSRWGHCPGGCAGRGISCAAVPGLRGGR